MSVVHMTDTIRALSPTHVQVMIKGVWVDYVYLAYAVLNEEKPIGDQLVYCKGWYRAENGHHVEEIYALHADLERAVKDVFMRPLLMARIQEAMR